MFVVAGLSDLYDYDLRRVESVCDGMDGLCIGCVDVLKAHFYIADFFLEAGRGGLSQPGVMNEALLASCVARQSTGFGGNAKWKNEYEKCATLVYGIVKNHCFFDANKRTAILIMLLYMYHYLKVVPTAKKRILEDFIVKVADGTVLKSPYSKKIAKSYPGSSTSDLEIYTIARFIRNNSRKRDNMHYSVSFSKLDTMLHAHNFCLANPYRNQIDICLYDDAAVGDRVTQIGFPGWTREVPRSTIKLVRQATGLIEARGVDSFSFYHGGDPLPHIINEYSSLLERLADR